MKWRKGCASLGDGSVYIELNHPVDPNGLSALQTSTIFTRITMIISIISQQPDIAVTTIFRICGGLRLC